MLSEVVFQTERLIVRRLVDGDVEALERVYGDPQVARWAGDGQPLSRALCERWVIVTHDNYRRRGYGMFALQDRGTGQTVGFAGLVHPDAQPEAEIKYALDRRHWGRGLGTEAARALLAYGASRFGLRSVIATTKPDNHPSHRVLTKAGMTRGELRRNADGSYTQLFDWTAAMPESGVDIQPRAEPLVLEGQWVRLRPMCREDAPALVKAASDGELWNLPYTIVPSAQTVGAYVQSALDAQTAGTALPLVTELRQSGEVLGSTRFFEIDRPNRKLEIGYTWLAASWQRSYVNTEAKYLMLRHAFDQLKCIRVQFTTDEINLKSRAAILRLGAVPEGLVRYERIMPDGRRRNSMRFSIIEEEWPSVRAALQGRLGLAGDN